MRAAGALRQNSGGLVVAQLQGNPVTWYSSTPGFATMLPRSTGQVTLGPLLPTALADTLGVRPGDTIVFAMFKAR